MKISAIHVGSCNGQAGSTVLLRGQTPTACLKKAARAIVAFYKRNDVRDKFDISYRIGEVCDKHSPHPNLTIYHTERLPFAGPREEFEEELDQLVYSEVWILKGTLSGKGAWHEKA